MPIAFNVTSNRLTLTGGDAQNLLTPNSIITEANAFAQANPYNAGDLVQYNNSDGLGLSLWSANAAIPANTAFSTANWTRRAYRITGNNGSMFFNAHLDVAAFFTTTNWNVFIFADSFWFRCATGCKWTDNTSSSSSNGLTFSCFGIGNNTNQNAAILSSTSAADYWRTNRVTITVRGSGSTAPRSDIVFANVTAGVGPIDATMEFQCNTLNIDTTQTNTANNSIRLAPSGTNSFITNVREIQTNFTLNPLGVSNLTFVGLNEANIDFNKIGILNPSKTNPLNGFAPDFSGTKNAFSLIQGGTNQTFRDPVLPDTFNPTTTGIRANSTNTSAWVQRTVNLFYRRQGTEFSASVYFNPSVTNVGSPDQVVAPTNTTTDGNDNFVLDTFYGRKTSATGYTTFNTYSDGRTYTVLIRRQQDIEAINTINLGANLVATPQVLDVLSIVDPYWGSDQSGLGSITGTFSPPLITNNNSSQLTVDNLYDWTKFWLTQSAQMAGVPTNPFSATGVVGSGTAVFNMGSYSLTMSASAPALNAGPNFNTITTTGTITLGVVNLFGSTINVRYNAGTIALPGSATVSNNITATNQITGLSTAGIVALNNTVGFGTSSSITMTGNLTFSSCVLSGTCSLVPQVAGRTLTLSNCGDLSVNFPFTNSSGTTISVIGTGTTVLPASRTGFTFQTTYTLSINATGDMVGGAMIVFDTSRNIVTNGSIVSLPAGLTNLTSNIPFGRVVWGKSGFNFVNVLNPTGTVNFTPQSSGITGSNTGPSLAPAWQSQFTFAATPAVQIGVTVGTASGATGIGTATRPYSSTETYQRLEFLKGGSSLTGQTGIPMLRALEVALNGNMSVTQFYNVTGGVPTLSTQEIDFISYGSGAFDATVQRFITGVGLNGITFDQITSVLSNSPGNPQVVNAPDPNASLGVVSAAVSNVVTPNLTVINNNVKNASLLVPATGNLTG